MRFVKQDLKGVLKYVGVEIRVPLPLQTVDTSETVSDIPVQSKSAVELNRFFNFFTRVICR